MASTWAATANNETISFNNLKDAVDTGVLSPKTSIPVSNEQINKDEANTYVYIDTAFGPYASKSSNQLVVKSNLQCGVPVISTPNLRWDAIDNNQTTSSPIQLLVGYNNNLDGRIFRSTDFGQNYSSVLIISDSLYSVKFMPGFRHASYLSVVPFLAVGNGRIVTNSVTDCSSWITISSPTTNALFGIAFNNLAVAIIVGNNRILKNDTNNRINSWSIVNSVTATWRDVASDGSVFVAVGDNGSIITGNSLGTTWTTRSMPPLSASGIDLLGITYHTDGYFYAVGYPSANNWYMMRSSDQGVNWTAYIPTNFALFSGRLISIESIAGRLVIGGDDFQYQIRNDVVTRCNASLPSSNTIRWNSIVKDANSSNGFDMAGAIFGINGAYSNF
jgi:hypothetical protein